MTARLTLKHTASQQPQVVLFDIFPERPVSTSVFVRVGLNCKIGLGGGSALSFSAGGSGGFGTCVFGAQGQIGQMQMSVETEQETDGRWIAEIAQIPGVLAYGVSREEAVSKVEALALRVLAERLDHGEIPEDLKMDSSVAV